MQICEGGRDMTIFGIEIVLCDAIFAVLCLVGVMVTISGMAAHRKILRCIGMTLMALGICLAFYWYRG